MPEKEESVVPVNTLTDLINPLSVEDFLKKIVGAGRVWHSSEIDRAERFASLFSWDDLRILIRDHQFTWPRLRLADGGSDIPPSSYAIERNYSTGDRQQMIAAHQLHKSLDEGALLVLDRVNEIHPSVGRLVESIEHALREHCHADVFAALKATATGFGMHWDDHDALIVQIHGSKRWRFAESSRVWPVQKDFHDQNPKPADFDDELIVRPGDLLYVPRGVWHAVEPVDGPALHLSIDVVRSTGMDLLKWMSTEMVKEIDFRKDLPRYSDKIQQSDHLATLMQAMCSRLQRDGAMNDFFADRDATAPIRRPRLHLPTFSELVKDGRTLVQWTAPRAVILEDAEVVLVRADGTEWTFDSRCSPILQILESMHDSSIDDITSELPSIGADFIREVLLVLGQEGLVDFSVLPNDQTGKKH